MRQYRLLTIATLLLFLLCRAQPLSADEGKLYTADKMSSSTINCVTQDGYGFIWVGTEYGLNRFDGYQFVKYFTDVRDSASLVSNEVTAFLTDSRGQLWVGCRKGLARYDYRTDKFCRYAFPDGAEPRVVSMVEDEGGTIFVATSGYGLYAIPASSDRVVQPSGFSRQYADKFIGSVFVDDRRNVWCSGLESQLTRYTVDGLQPTYIADFQTGCGPVVRFLKIDGRGFYVVCMHGILYFDYQRGQLLPADYALDALGPDVSIRDACADRLGNLYIGTSGMGLMVLPRDGRTMTQVTSAEATFNLASANVNYIFEDRSQNLWVGCNKKGLYLLRHSQSAFTSWLLSAQGYVLGSSVSSIAPADDGDVFCVVQKYGIFRFNAEGKVVGQLHSPDAPTRLYRDGQQRYWLGTENALYEYDPVKQTARQRLHIDGWGVSCIADDGEGTLFIGNDGKGLLVYDQQSGQQRSFSMQDEGRKNGTVVNNWIRALYYDSHGLLWIGSVDGLGCMDPKNDNFRVMGWEIQFKGYKCYSLYEQPDASMLIGTEAGIYVCDRQTGEFSLFPGSEEMQNKSIYSIVGDRLGNLWMSTADGIWHYDARRRAFSSYVTDDGLEMHEYVVGAHITTADGRILFGNYDGITAFYPQEVKDGGLQMGPVFLTQFTVNGQRQDCRQRRFELPHDDNTFHMEFSMLDFRKTDNTAFVYRINDGDTWAPIPDGTHLLSFNKMKPGTYNIEVAAMERGGERSEQPCRLTVVVRPPWYQSPLAWVLYVAGLVGLIGLIGYMYRRRTREQLEESKMRFLINATHDIRSPLTLIMGPLKKLQERVAVMDNAEEAGQMDHYLSIIDRNAQRLLLLVNQILDERRIDKDQLRLHCRETDMVAFTASICKMYEYNAQERNIRFSFQHDGVERLDAWIDRKQFDKVINNLLSNAFKYSYDDGEVEVRLQLTQPTKRQPEQQLLLQVIDNGIGFSKGENTSRLFERFYQGANQGNIHAEGSGIGLNLSRSIVQLHGGTIRAFNRTDGQRGACLEVTLPLGNKHLKPEAIATDEEPEAPAIEKQRRRHQPTQNYRILVADDDKEIARYISSELGFWYRIDAVPNGKEALKALFAESYDLVISDIMMPEMDGVQLLKSIKGTPQLSDIPVILLTSKTEVSHRLEGIRNGADSYIAKPFAMDELHVQIDNLINNVRRLRGKFSGALSQKDKVDDIQVRGNNDALMARIVKVVNENLNDPSFNVQQLITEVGISRAQLHRKMKEITGVSTADFIRNLRLQQAERLIREHKVNITQIAYTVGFNNQSHFSTIFRKYYGMTPTEYAEKHQEEEGSEK